MLSQADFDRFIENYNEDYYFLLKRASTGVYECLLTSFMVLKDLLEVIETLSRIGGLRYVTEPHPLYFRSQDALLATLGFDASQITNIYGFLAYVKQTQGRDFEECVAEGVSRNCLPVAGRA
jgi:hypothetical protein